jgi:effector-binding domain-containing protein
MTVDFAFARAPRIRVAAITWKGPWNEAKVRSQFRRVSAWAKQHGVRTGRWIFRHPGGTRWEASIEVKGPVRSSAPVRLKTLPATTVARVVFDPDVVAPRVIYHGLSDWLRWRRREHQIRTVVSSREIYSGDPWKVARAWARTEVQFVVRK